MIFGKSVEHRWLASGLGFAVVFASCSQAPEPDLLTPSACFYDEQSDVYLVSNVHGSPVAKDDNGFILQISPIDGTRTAWVSGEQDDVTLHAPKGMAVVDGVLWVADIDVLRQFDLTSGAQLSDVTIPGATFLSDVSAAPDGTVYCTDAGLDENFEPTGSDAIWRIHPDGVPTALMKTPALGHPMSLVARDGGIYVVSWRDGAFFEVDYRGVRTELGVAPQGNLQGLVRVAKANSKTGNQKFAQPMWYASSSAGKAIYRFGMTGAVAAMPMRLEDAAGLGYDSRRNCLLIPLAGSNRVRIEQL